VSPFEGAPVSPFEGAPVSPFEGAPLSPPEIAPAPPFAGAVMSPFEGAVMSPFEGVITAPFEGATMPPTESEVARTKKPPRQHEETRTFAVLIRRIVPSRRRQTIELRPGTPRDSRLQIANSTFARRHRCSRASIPNDNTRVTSIPGDSNGAWYTSGIRLGTPALTTLGFSPDELDEVADVIVTALRATTPATSTAKAKYEIDARVAQLSKPVRRSARPPSPLSRDRAVKPTRHGAVRILFPEWIRLRTAFNVLQVPPNVRRPVLQDCHQRVRTELRGNTADKQLSRGVGGQQSGPLRAAPETNREAL